MAFLCAVHELRPFVDAPTWERGQALLREGKVRQCERSETGAAQGALEWQVRGKVQGTQRQPYEVQVRLKFSAAGQLERFAGGCSCPMAVDC